MRILVVEDDALIREFVVEALREEGYDVIHASNGEEGHGVGGRSPTFSSQTPICLGKLTDGRSPNVAESAIPDCP